MLATRRAFLHSMLAVTLGFRGLRSLLAAEPGRTAAAPGPGYGPLIPDPNKLLDLPERFTYTVVSRAGERMDDGFLVPGKPDGMATFPGPGGKTILVRNHELLADRPENGPYGSNNELLEKLPKEFSYDRGREQKPCLGGTTTLLYDTGNRRLERQFLSLAGTQYNCAGGPTPWGTWVTCEEDVQQANEVFEKGHGYAFEVPARADGKLVRPVPIVAMGRFRREAIAVDPKTGVVYQTEDREDGLLYRYIPQKQGDLLAGGRVQALCAREYPSLDARNWMGEDGKPLGPDLPVGTKLAARWIDLDDLQAPNDDLRARGFAQGAAKFAREEGIWYGKNGVFFACTEGGKIRKGQIWKYTPSPNEGADGESDQPGTVELFIEPNDTGLIDNADNLTVAPWGDLIVCEDGSGEQFVVGVTPGGGLYKLARSALGDSEFAGSVFSPDGSTLFVNLQGAGLTLAVHGPWHARPS